MIMKHPAGDQHWTRTKPDRVLRGTRAPGAKLDIREIEELCAAFDAGVNKSQLAREYGVSRITIWRHIRDRNTRKSGT